MNAAMPISAIAMLTVAILLEVLPVLAWRDIMEMEKSAQVGSKTFLLGSHKYCKEIRQNVLHIGGVEISVL